MHQLFQKSDASGSRSTILKPLTWIISIFSTVIITLAYEKINPWLIFYFVFVVTIAIGIFFYAYLHCLKSNPDALRSERFSIQKMAIEKGYYGDSLTGMFEIDNQTKNSTTIAKSDFSKNDDNENTQ